MKSSVEIRGHLNPGTPYIFSVDANGAIHRTLRAGLLGHIRFFHHEETKKHEVPSVCKKRILHTLQFSSLVFFVALGVLRGSMFRVRPDLSTEFTLSKVEGPRMTNGGGASQVDFRLPIFD
jgi:hypothetical protein